MEAPPIDTQIAGSPVRQVLPRGGPPGNKPAPPRPTNIGQLNGAGPNGMINRGPPTNFNNHAGPPINGQPGPPGRGVVLPGVQNIVSGPGNGPRGNIFIGGPPNGAPPPSAVGPRMTPYNPPINGGPRLSNPGAPGQGPPVVAGMTPYLPPGSAGPRGPIPKSGSFKGKVPGNEGEYGEDNPIRSNSNSRKNSVQIPDNTIANDLSFDDGLGTAVSRKSSFKENSLSMTQPIDRKLSMADAVLSPTLIRHDSDNRVGYFGSADGSEDSTKSRPSGIPALKIINSASSPDYRAVDVGSVAGKVIAGNPPSKQPPPPVKKNSSLTNTAAPQTLVTDAGKQAGAGGPPARVGLPQIMTTQGPPGMNVMTSGSFHTTIGSPVAAMQSPQQTITGMMQPVMQTTMQTTILSPTGAILPVISGQKYSTARPTQAPKPMAGHFPHAVKETTDVKRNKIELPSHMQHAAPTAGDWMNKRYIVNNYILLNSLGQGAYAEVRLCKDRRTEQLYAIKIINRDFLKKRKHGVGSETFLEDIKREIAIMKKLMHPNVLRLYEVLDDSKVNKLYLVLEYMKMGDLIGYIEKKFKEANPGLKDEAKDDKNTMRTLPDSEVWNIFKQVAAGIRYLHYQNVVHGDIKPQNLLVGENGIIKIADFGISNMLSDNTQMMTEGAGTPAFMSPELCSGKAFSGQLADVWALGATMFMLKYGHPPWIASNVLNLYSKIQNDPLIYPPNIAIDPALKDLLSCMMEKDPTQRYTIQNVVQHPWFRQPPPPPATPPVTILAAVGDSVGKPSAPDGENNYSFAPPQSYDQELVDAMQGPVVTAHEEEMYLSIGFTKQDKPDDGFDIFSTCVDDVDEEEGDDEEQAPAKKPAAEPVAEPVEMNKKMMDTTWGDDVFEMVADDDEEEGDDDVDDDEALTPMMQTAESKSANVEQTNSDSCNIYATTHSEMSTEEEEKRKGRFMKKKKKSSSLVTVQGAVAFKSGSQKAKKKAVDEDEDEDDDEEKMDDSVRSLKLPPSIASVMRSKMAAGEKGRRGSVNESIAEADLTDDFASIMDTLALQPVHPIAAHASSSLPIHQGPLVRSQIRANLSNANNELKIAFHSEQGVRDNQEDRLVVVANVSELPIIQGDEFAHVREPLDMFSVVCVFDGHNGDTVSEHLSQHFANRLAIEPKLTVANKVNLASLLTSLCTQMDDEICEELRNIDDPAGSTGIIAVYDGRKHALTIANVGDSSCIICRSDGVAVRLLRLHRVTDELERRRIETQTTGKILNNRVNGILAVSRSFGDAPFKDVDESTRKPLPSNPVTACPDVHTEIISTSIEFAVLGTDGLFDIMKPQVVTDFVRSSLKITNDLNATAEALTKEAIRLGSIDNVSVIILLFHSGCD